MVYANDQWVQLPVRDLYDTQVMAMAINAARDMYEKGLAEMKDFQKTYGEFMTPITADLAWWQLNVNDPVRNTINAFYEQGIDPLRNPQARAMISKLINNMPYGDMLFKKLRAKNAEEYYKNMAVLKANNKYDKDFSEFLNEDPNQWAANYAGTTSPTLFLTLKDATNDWYNNRTPRDLTPEEKKRLGLDSRYNYSGYFDSDLMNVAKNLTPGWQGTPQAAYYRELAKRLVLARGDEATPENIEALLLRNIADSQQEWLVGPTQGKADEFVLDDYRTANNIRADKAKAATEYYYSILPYADTNGDGNISNKEMAKYVKLNQQSLSNKGKSNSNNGGNNDEAGYNIAEDVYITLLAKAAGIEYFPKDGVDVNDLPSMLREATKNQNTAIKNKGSVLAATGMFLAPQKIAGLILSDGKNGYGYFLNPGYFKNLHSLEDVRTSYKGWLMKGVTNEESKNLREGYKQLSKDIITAARETLAGQTKKGEYRLKVVPTVDLYGNNVYGMVGEDGKWHTYARVRVYLSNGKLTMPGGTQTKYNKTDEMGRLIVNEDRKKESDDPYKTEKRYAIPKEGIDMVLEVGLHSNEGKASPDLSISAREDLGFYGFDATKREVGINNTSGWPYGTNILKK